ncbi:MAG: sigma-70 family RNA polymerase sigma factor, partial [Verrucomicrobiales bacterium]|nr:sigma-70 family RNA polymerase sigma factor [Verrucomicrobiales bacterium]
MDDAELLREYVARRSEEAFAELVRRHVDLVHSVALRRTSDHALAQEITQGVFLILARKAATVAGHACVPAWLHRTASQVAARAVRSEVRRRHRESSAVDQGFPNMDTSDVSDDVLRSLDTAMERLGAPDHAVLVHRYFQRKSMKEVGVLLGTTEAAAKMRVHRALERLRTELLRAGVGCTPAGLAAVLERSAVLPAPGALSAVVARAVAASTTASSAGGVVSSVVLFMSSLKTTSLVGAALLLALLGGTLWMRSDEDSDGGTETDAAATAGGDASSDARASTRGVPKVGRGSRGPLGDAELAEARRVLEAALTIPLAKSGISWPEPKVLEALERFGDRRDAAFAALRDFLSRPLDKAAEPNSSEAWLHQLARGRAFSALGTLPRDVPGLRPFLWEHARSKDASDAPSAFIALRQLGFDASDAPDLVERMKHADARSPALNQVLSESVRTLSRTHPDAAGAWTPDVVALLEDANPGVRLRAASALMGTPAEADPRVVESLRSGLKGGEAEALIAIRAATAGGDRSQGLIPDLKAYADSAERPHLKSLALKAIAAIDSKAGETLPEVAAEQARAASSEAIRNRVNSATRTFDDLVAGLREPAVAEIAARALADWGAGAASAMPALRAALAGRDEESRDRIVDAMRKIDPSVRVEQVP